MGQEERDSWRCKKCNKIFDPMECNVKYGDYPRPRGRPRKQSHSKALQLLIKKKNEIQLDNVRIHEGAVKISEWEKEFFDAMIEDLEKRSKK